MEKPQPLDPLPPRRARFAPPGGTTILRVALALVVLLATLRLFLPPAPVEGPEILLLWPVFATALGFAIGRWWALPLALLPQLCWWWTVRTGPEYLTYGDGREIAAIIFIILGLIGIAIGIAARRWAAIHVPQVFPASVRPIERLVLPVALLVLFGAALLDGATTRAFVSAPRPVEARRYTDEEVRGATADLDFAVYAAPTTEGLPTGALRRALPAPGLPPTDTFTLIYCDDRCRRSSDVQIMSAPLAYGAAARQRGGTSAKPVPTPAVTPVEVAGIVWQVEGSGPDPGRVSANADLNDAYVRIDAPSLAHFERVAASLRRVNR